MIDGPSQVDFLDGGGPSLVCLSFAELDRDGNVNVTRLKQMPHVLAGAGGFSNIIQKARRLIFCGTMTAGGVKYDIAGGRIKLLRAGKFKKVVPAVQQVTFNGPLAFQKGQKVLYITDLCVFDLTAQGLRLIEIAPGVDLEEDILAHIDFEVIQAPGLCTTDPVVYGDCLGLKTQPKWRR